MRPLSRSLRPLLTVAVAALVLLTAGVAAACPVCAQRAQASWLGPVALGAFIVTPWLLAIAGYLYIRRSLRRQPASSPINPETSE